MIIEGKNLIVGNHLSVMDLTLSKLLVLVLKEKGVKFGGHELYFWAGDLTDHFT